MDGFAVTVRAGGRAAGVPGDRVAHAWTSEGVAVESDFTGAHLLHLAVAGCVLNDVYREAQASGIAVDGVEVSARGAFDTATWTSTGITYTVEVDTDAPPDTVAALLARVDAVAEIPKAVRAGTTVRRVD